MFASKAARFHTNAAEPSSGELARQGPLPLHMQAGRDGAPPLRLLQRSIRNESPILPLESQAVSSTANQPSDQLGPGSTWSFSKIPIFPEGRATGRRSALLVTAPFGAIQRKLQIGAVDDPLEHEADRVAEQVMRMPDPEAASDVSLMGNKAYPTPSDSRAAVQRKCSCGGSCDKCKDQEADDAHGKLHRKPETSPTPRDASSSVATGVQAPRTVHEVLRSPGQPLDATSRAFFEPRFGCDFSKVRVHADETAATSARDVDARAYTVGQNLVFASNQFSPGTSEGRRLIGHELAHVVQQSGLSVPPLQRACRSASACAAPTAGNPGAVGVQATAEEAVLDSGPTPCHAEARHGDPATNVKSLVAGAGLGVTVPPQVHGIFINKCLPSNIDGQRTDCTNFPGGAPTGAPADKSCIGVPVTTEDKAKAISAKTPAARSASDKQFTVDLSAIIKHEGQHATFNAGASGIITETADCKLDTVVTFPEGTDTVRHLLSEMSAEISEFDVYFRNRNASPGKPSQFALETEEHNIATRSGESLLGAIKSLQCACECSTVDAFTKQVFENIATAWTADEKTEFQKAMTGFMPSFWPKALQKKS